MLTLSEEDNVKHSIECGQFCLHSKNQVSAHANWKLRTLTIVPPLPCVTCLEFSATPEKISWSYGKTGEMENVGDFIEIGEIWVVKCEKFVVC